MLRFVWHALLAHLPYQSNGGVARKLISRAKTACGAGRYMLAAGLYEEALLLWPDAPHLHVQCGHMFKEAGHYGAAEDHYRAALRSLSDDPDLALQLGHFYKLVLRPDEAEEAYRRALALRPGWVDAADELARVRSSVHQESAGAQVETVGQAGIVPELLPRENNDVPVQLDRLRVTHLAPRRQRTEWGNTKVLRGIEAIRGHCISPAKMTEVCILLDGQEVVRAPLQAHPIAGTDRVKYVFNVWHDFSDVKPGRYLVEVRLEGGHLSSRKHREHLVIVSPWREEDWPNSDGVVAVDEPGPGELEARINARASMARSASRTLLPENVRTILVQRPDQLGDLVCSVPAIRRLREIFPEARIVGLLTAANAELGGALGLFNEIVIAEFGQNGEGHRTMTPEAQIQLRRKLAARNIDIAIDLCEVSDSRPLLLLSGAPFLYGFSAKEYPWLSAGFEFTCRDGSNGLETLPASRKILALVESLGALQLNIVSPQPNERSKIDILCRYAVDGDKPFVVLHAGARLAFSRWPHFAELARLILDRTKYNVVLMGEVLPDVMPSKSGRLTVIEEMIPFSDFDALLSSCSGFVGNDSGTKHLAALRGAPVVSLHMARLNWNEWGQDYGGAIISRRVPCAGCGIHNKPEECGKHFACIRMIEPEEVMTALLLIMLSR